MKNVILVSIFGLMIPLMAIGGGQYIGTTLNTTQIAAEKGAADSDARTLMNGGFNNNELIKVSSYTLVKLLSSQNISANRYSISEEPAPSGQIRYTISIGNKSADICPAGYCPSGM